jgi:hypothetical protein
MKVGLVLVIAALALALASPLAAGAGSSADAGPRYVFSFKSGLKSARIGATTTGYQALFRKAVRLPDLGGEACFALRYAVSPAAQRSRKADLHLYCGDSTHITEAHLASSAFCSTGGTCIATPGSLRRFVAELNEAASVQTGMECIDGRTGCSTVEASFGRIQVSVRSSNCRSFASLTAIGPQCAAGDVLIYRLD